MLWFAARLPDALVGVSPDCRGTFGLCPDQRPEALRQALAAPRVQEDGVERRAEDVVLTLVEGAVSDAHGAGSRIPGELGDDRLREIAPTVDPVHDLQPAVAVRLDIRHELHELVGLPVQVQVVQRLQGEGRVADPRVAVVPVALAAGVSGSDVVSAATVAPVGMYVRPLIARRTAGWDRATGGPGCVPCPASCARISWSPRAALSRRRGRREPRAARPTTARRTPSPPPRACASPGRDCPRCRARGRCGAGSSAPHRWRRPCAGCRRPASTPPASGRSRSSARRSAGPRRGPPGTRPCAPACGRHRHRRAAGCAG